ncbi:MAG: 4Fe-4S binding protein [Candidatus Schekmanbacteria bacterium]|nr:4Fe-4S binding protein [Candidatus Schekmanbacteria bacterium]
MDEIREKITSLIKDGKAGSVLAIVKNGINVIPVQITAQNLDEVSNICLDERRYPIEKMLASVIDARDDSSPVGVVLRPCEKAAVIELHKLQHINMDDVILIDIDCSKELRDKCACDWKDDLVVKVKEGKGFLKDETLDTLESSTSRERWEFWSKHFARCIKCYGCRNVCPVCICKACCLEEADVVEKGELPPEFPIFHLARAVDVAGRCIDCGKCEEACPVDIPLRLIHKKVFRDFIRDFKYIPGASIDEKCPLDFIESIKEEGD